MILYRNPRYLLDQDYYKCILVFIILNRKDSVKLFRIMKYELK